MQQTGQVPEAWLLVQESEVEFFSTQDQLKELVPQLPPDPPLLSRHSGSSLHVATVHLGLQAVDMCW